MSITHAGGVRDDLANVVGDAHDAGSGTAVLEIRDDATVLITFPLDNPAFDTAPATSEGRITLQDTPIEVTAEADGDADNFVTRDRDGNIVLAGSVTATGMGGDIEVSNISVADNQPASLDSLTYDAPA